MSRSLLVSAEVKETDLSSLNISKHGAPVPIPNGTKFGYLTATKEFELRKRPDGRNRCYQKFVCDCGNAVFLVGYSVKNGNTRSCGCYQTYEIKTRMTTHGKSRTGAYKVNKERTRRALKKATQAEEITLEMLQNHLSKFNNSCWICEVELNEVTWDHVQPLSKGGSHTLSNLKPACRPCNTKKNAIWPFTDEIKTNIANVVRALRTTQAHTLPVTDGLEVHDVCLS